MGQIIATVDQDGLTQFIRAVVTTRKRYVHYGSPTFVAQTTSQATSLPAIPFPNVPGGIQYEVQFQRLELLLHPTAASGTNPFTTAANQLILHAAGSFQTIDPGPVEQPVGTVFEAWALMQLRWLPGASVGPSIGLDVLDVAVPGITPAAVQQVIQAVVQTVLQAALNNVLLPINPLAINAATLRVDHAPTIDANRIQIVGTI